MTPETRVAVSETTNRRCLCWHRGRFYIYLSKWSRWFVYGRATVLTCFESIRVHQSQFNESLGVFECFFHREVRSLSGVFMATTTQRKRLKPAGGYPIVDGCAEFPNVERRDLRSWRNAVRRFIVRKVKQGDAEVIAMIREAECEWLTFECQPFHHWTNCTPLGKAQTLIAWILRQGREKKSGYGWNRRRHTTLDILVNGIAADLWVTHGPSKLKSPYYRAVQIGRAVRFLLLAEFREYEQDHTNGLVTLSRIKITQKIRMRSRNACQRLETVIKRHAGWFLRGMGERFFNEYKAVYYGAL